MVPLADNGGAMVPLVLLLVVAAATCAGGGNERRADTEPVPLALPLPLVMGTAGDKVRVRDRLECTSRYDQTQIQNGECFWRM